MDAIKLSPYLEQAAQWPQKGQHIMAQYDEQSIIVYQAYKPSIGRFAAAHGYFGHGFKLGRMTWIKPNFLWMMFRCGWAQKTDQETVLAIRLKREAFELILAEAVHSSYQPQHYPTHAAWKQQVTTSDVRLQWDPDHDPEGEKTERRAIQLGLRGDYVISYAKEWILEIEDITEFVATQRHHANHANWGNLLVPHECVYTPSTPSVIEQLGISSTIAPNVTS